MNNETNYLFIRAATVLNKGAFLSNFVVIHAMLAYSMFVVVVGKFSSRRHATYYRTHKTMAVHNTASICNNINLTDIIPIYNKTNKCIIDFEWIRLYGHKRVS